jgi:hypothetical protein
MKRIRDTPQRVGHEKETGDGGYIAIYLNVCP